MNYPLVSEYIEAIKAAEDNFSTLTNLQPVLDDEGNPIMSSGNFAVVFKMKNGQTGKLHAVKCFLKEQKGRAEAYRMIAEELEYVSSTFLTPIKYLDKELFVDSKNSDETEFPVLLMDWVEGMTLDKYIRQHIDDQYELSLLAYQFSRLAMWLMPQPFAHGDLKPDNILVKEDGTLVLVDYDGMYVPAMKGRKARELGSPDFRHPSRTEEVFDDHIDDFSLANILLSLKAIALQPSLLEEHGASDRLLFSEKDYRNLSESSALGALQPLMQDAELASLYSLYILALSQNNLSQVSFRLFNLKRPDKSQYKEESLSTEVTEDDLANAWIDEYGVKYSADKKRLLYIPSDINSSYFIEQGTEIICDCSIRVNTNTIVIPSTVHCIGKNPFEGNSANVICESESFIVQDGLLLTSDKKRLIACLSHNKTIITIPNETIYIDEFAFFQECSWWYDNPPYFIRLQNKILRVFRNDYAKLIVPNEKMEQKLVTMGFARESFIVGDVYVDEYGVVYSFDKTKLLCYPKELNNTEYYIIEGCQEIVSGGFNYLPDPDDDGYLHVIGNQLITLHFPSSLVKIGIKALQGCTKLERIYYDSQKQIIVEEMLSEYSDYQKINWVSLMCPEEMPEHMTEKWEDEFGGIYSQNRKVVLGLGSLYKSEYEIKEGTEVIYNNAFCDLGNEMDYSYLEKITIPASVKAIGHAPFNKYLSEIICYSTNFEVREKTLYTKGRKRLIQCHADSEEFSIPDSVEYIDNFAFYGCKSKRIIIPASVNRIGINPFVEINREDYKFEVISLSPNFYVKNQSLYDNNLRLISYWGKDETISIDDGVKEIGEYAFFLSELKTINLPDSINSIGDCAFGWCFSLKQVLVPSHSAEKFNRIMNDYNDMIRIIE